MPNSSIQNDLQEITENSGSLIFEIVRDEGDGT